MKNELLDITWLIVILLLCSITIFANNIRLTNNVKGACSRLPTASNYKESGLKKIYKKLSVKGYNIAIVQNPLAPINADVSSALIIAKQIILSITIKIQNMSTIKVKDVIGFFCKNWGTGPPVVSLIVGLSPVTTGDAQKIFFLRHGFKIATHDRREPGTSVQKTIRFRMGVALLTMLICLNYFFNY